MGGEDSPRLVLQGGPSGILAVAVPGGGDVLACEIMGWNGLHLRVIAPDQQDMTVAHTRMEVEGVGRAFRIKGGDKLARLFAADVPGGIVDHLYPPVCFMGQGDQVAAEGGLLRAQGQAHGRGFERGAAGVILLGPVAQQGKVGHVTTRWIALRDGTGEKQFAPAAEGVEKRCLCRFQRGAVV